MHGRRIIIQTLHPASGTTCIIPPQELSHLVGGGGVGNCCGGTGGGARSPSHGKCSKRFCGSSRSYGRSHRPRQHEAFDCHAFKRNRQEECVQMPVKIARSAPRPSFGLPELLVAIHTSRQSCYKAGKSANIHASSGVIRESRLRTRSRSAIERGCSKRSWED